MNKAKSKRSAMIVRLPEKYQWLLKEPHPRIMTEMLFLYGTKEVVGKEHNPDILAWAEEIQEYVGVPYEADEVPWCGLVVGVSAERAGFNPPHLCIRAKEWEHWGVWSQTPKLGDVMVFNRKGGGHVGLYVAEDDECYHVLGGNQSNEVNITRIVKNRLTVARECPWKFKRPNNLRAILVDKSGIISHNEA